MDPLLAAGRLPRIADLAMRSAVARALAGGARPTLRALADDALARFERAMGENGGACPALLFAERNRIVHALRAFLATRLAIRLFTVPRRDRVVSAARPFDAVIRGRDGRLHAVMLRTVPRDGRRLELYRRVRAAAEWGTRAGALASVTLYDLGGGPVRTLHVAGAMFRAA